MTVTVDINVLLDVFQHREPHYTDSAEIVALIASKVLIGVYPAHGLTTLYYLIRKHSTKLDAEKALDQVLRYFHIGNLDATGWQEARDLPLADFEDAAVATVARASGSTFIITRDVDDFVASPVPAITPTDFLGQPTPSS